MSTELQKFGGGGASSGAADLEFRHVTKIGEPKKDNSVLGYYLPDGTTEVRNILPIADFTNLPIELVEPQKRIGKVLEDDEASRHARIKDFESKTLNSTVNLEQAIDPEISKSWGDKIIATVSVNEIRGHPASTDNLNIVGNSNVSLIRGENGFVKLQVSVVQGEYNFTADETFFQRIAGATVGCCCIITCMVGASASKASIRYTQKKNVFAQDYILPVSDTIIDAVLFRKAFVYNEASFDSSNSSAEGDLGGCLGTFIKNMLSLSLSNARLCFICSSGQFRLNPWLSFLKCQNSLSCTDVIKLCLCYKESGSDTLHEIQLHGSDKYVIGENYERRVAKKRHEYAKEIEPFFMNFPIYCGGVCFQYKDPLEYGESIGGDVFYCCTSCSPPVCANSVRRRDDPAAVEGPKWESTTDIKNEMRILIHYRHLVDGLTKKLELVIKPEEGQVVDDVYLNARKFINELGSARGALNLEFKDRKLGSRTNIPTLANFDPVENPSDALFGGNLSAVSALLGVKL